MYVLQSRRVYTTLIVDTLMAAAMVRGGGCNHYLLSTTPLSATMYTVNHSYIYNSLKDAYQVLAVGHTHLGVKLFIVES